MGIAYDPWGTPIDSNTGSPILSTGQEGYLQSNPNKIYVKEATLSPTAIAATQNPSLFETITGIDTSGNVEGLAQAAALLTGGTPQGGMGGGSSAILKILALLAGVGGLASATGAFIGGVTGEETGELLDYSGQSVPAPSTTTPVSGAINSTIIGNQALPSTVIKSWPGIGGSTFYQLINGRIIVQKRNGVLKVVRRPRMLHMKVSNPRMGDVVKADRIVAKVSKVLRRRLKK